MGTALDELIELLQLEQLEVNLFRGLSPDENRQRVFGGQVAGQALIAAGRTVEHGIVHSLHAYFLRPGDPRVPIIYDVDRIRDGRSFTTRRVVAIQHGKAIFNLSTSFHVLEPGPEHQYTMPDAPDPESLPTMRERLEPHKERFPPEFADWIMRDRPIDTRSADLPRWLDPEPGTRASRAARVVPRRREAARRPAAARLHRRVRLRPHAARHRGDGARALVGRRPLHDRQPRPRHVVPPAAARRRVAAVPPAQSVGAGGARAWPKGSSTGATARSR